MSKVVSISAPRDGKVMATVDVLLALDSREQARLTQLEKTISEGLRTFVTVGRALEEIRSRRLYRDTHGTFERYCEDRWSIGSNYANKQITAAKVVETLGTDVPIPDSEAQARQLAPLLSEPELLRDVWNEAQLDGKPTADKIEQIVRARLTAASVPNPPRRVRLRRPGGDARHEHVMNVISDLQRVAKKWTPEGCVSLAPPQAKKQLRQLQEIRDFLPDLIAAVEYRAATPHQFMGR
jgi:hypothetical protein